MKPTKKAIALLAAAFAYKGKVMGSAIHTCQGTMPLWGQLVRAGFVLPIPGCGLGHSFSYEITKAGEQAVEAYFTANPEREQL